MWGRWIIFIVTEHKFRSVQYAEFWPESLKGRDHIDLDGDERRVILKKFFSRF
jgi:hypothetical protein